MIRPSANTHPAARLSRPFLFAATCFVAAALLLGASVRAQAAEPEFGIDVFDGLVADAGGGPLTQAGAHPSLFTTYIDYTTEIVFNELLGEVKEPIEDPKNIFVELPPGFVGSVAGMEQCTTSELMVGTPLDVKPQCPAPSQLGTLILHTDFGDSAPAGIYNMVPPPGVPARFGINVAAATIVIDSSVRGDSDFGLRSAVVKIPAGLSNYGSLLTLWGVPSDSSHDGERYCPGGGQGGGGPRCNARGEVIGAEGTDPSPPSEVTPFFRNPTACTEEGEGLLTTMRADSWTHPGAFHEGSYRTHKLPGYPKPAAQWGLEVGIDGCDQVPFEPSIEAQLTTNSADSPTGLNIDIALPRDCWDPKATAAEVEAAICQSDMREAAVTLPQGLSVNPSADGGLSSCSPAQVGLTTPLGSAPIHFNEAPVSCPDASKIGSVEIESPLLDDPIPGAIYLAQQGDNPFKSLLAMYLVAEGSGVRIKQAGKIELGGDGRIVTRFNEVPQQPFSNIHVELYGGPRAALRTPPACGTYSTQATLTPWSGNAAVNTQSSFQITQCGSGGFDPRFSAGTQNPLAGSFSPFSLRLSRQDGTQELSAISMAIPVGLVASLKDVPYCPDSVLDSFATEANGEALLGSGAAEISAPKCPAASRVGATVDAAGAGPNPFYTSEGRVYLAGPYKGAPLSLAVVTPAVAGPFDLGTVVVRNALRVNPETAQITAVSDPFPQVLHGIQLDLREIRVNVDRPNFTLNPTSCEPKSIEATITSVSGASAKRSQHFQAAACDRLRFKPKLSFRLKGKTNRGAHPALRAILTMPKGGANLAQASVALPRSEFLDQSHIGTICTRVQYVAGGGGGEQCPPKSIYGYARVYSAILGYYLQGPVFLRSSSHKLPDLVLGLKGPPSQPIQVDAVGRIDSTKGGGIRTSFEAVPDVPVSKVVLDMRGGKKGLLQNSTNICKGIHKATANLTAHNGALLEAQPEMKADCGPKARKGAKGKGKKADSYRR